MGVCIWRCNKDQENIIKESSIDCYKKTDQSLIPNIITSNNVNANEDDKKLIKLKYNKIFNDPKEKEKEKQKQLQQGINISPNINYTYSNNGTASNSTHNEKYVKSVVKIQSFFRKHTRIKEFQKNKEQIDLNKNKKKDKEKNKEDSLSLKLNFEMMETVFSSNSFNNSNISKEKSNNHEDSNVEEKNKDNESNN